MNCMRGNKCPDAVAYIKGGPLAPNIRGKALFYQCAKGVYITIEVDGMPVVEENGQESSFHGLHIHELGVCTVGDAENPFLGSGGHYNPNNRPHPFHAGDLPPLLSMNRCGQGSARMSVMTDRFTVKEIIGKAIIIHENADDFTTQPTGGAGKRWACGCIKSNC